MDECGLRDRISMIHLHPLPGVQEACVGKALVNGSHKIMIKMKLDSSIMVQSQCAIDVNTLTFIHKRIISLACLAMGL